MKRLIAPLALLVLTGCGASDQTTPDSKPSIAVTTTRIAQGSLPETITAYGTVSPSLSGLRTISFAQPGQVTALLVTPGLAVRQGQALLTFEPAASARSAYQQAVNAVHAAQVTQDTTRQLLAQQLATADQMAQANKALADAKATLAGLSAEGAGQTRTTVTAPFAGVIATLTVAQGDRTQPGAPLLTVARGDALVVSAGIDPARRVDVAPGQSVTLQRLNGGASLHGSVLRVAAALNPKTRLVDVDITLPPGALMPGEAVQAQIATHPVHGWIVPHQSVVTADGPAHVFQEAGGKAHLVPVTILLAGGQQDVVSGPLDAARPLVVEGAYQAHDGDALRRGQ